VLTCAVCPLPLRSSMTSASAGSGLAVTSNTATPLSAGTMGARASTFWLPAMVLRM
jgi:hypothetical protein